MAVSPPNPARQLRGPKLQGFTLNKSVQSGACAPLPASSPQLSRSFFVLANLILENWYLRETLSFIPRVYSKVKDHFHLLKSHVCVFSVNCPLTEGIALWCLIKLLVTLRDSAEVIPSRKSRDSRPA